MAIVAIARLTDLPEEGAKEIRVGDRIIALFRHAGSLYALDGLCPHRAGPLGQGDVADGHVTCPWHSWRFDLRTGINPDLPAARVRSYPCTVTADVVTIDLGEES